MSGIEEARVRLLEKWRRLQDDANMAEQAADEARKDYERFTGEPMPLEELAERGAV